MIAPHWRLEIRDDLLVNDEGLTAAARKRISDAQRERDGRRSGSRNEQRRISIGHSCTPCT